MPLRSLAHALVSGRDGPTMGTSYTWIEKKNNLAKIFYVLLHRSSQLLTDFTGTDDENLDGVPRNTCVCWCTGEFRLQSQTLQT